MSANPNDARKVVDNLNAADLRARLRDLASEARAVRSLLRIADNRDRVRYSRREHDRLCWPTSRPRAV
jgi:hypothetical protein